MGGSLSDQQLKEFDEYLSKIGEGNSANVDFKTPAPAAAPPKPAPVPAESVVETAQDIPGTGIVVDEIVKLHDAKVGQILNLLDQIDAKTHQEIVANLVDEMQYQKAVIRREQDNAEAFKKLLELAAQASK